jgi:hypothetical protein
VQVRSLRLSQHLHFEPLCPLLGTLRMVRLMGLAFSVLSGEPELGQRGSPACSTSVSHSSKSRALSEELMTLSEKDYLALRTYRSCEL